MHRVLRIVNRFNLGGPIYNAAYLTKYLEPDYQTLLIGGRPQEHESDSRFILEQMDIAHQVIPEMSRSIDPLSDWKAMRRIRRAIREYRPHIVHTHASKAGALGRMAARLEGVPVLVHTFHGHVFDGYFGPLKTQVYKGVERTLARNSSSIIAISPTQKSQLVDLHRVVSEDRVKVIPLGFDLSRFTQEMDLKRSDFRAKYALDEDTVAVGIIGRLVKIKGHDYFLDAVEQVMSKEYRQVRFFVIGDGVEGNVLRERGERINRLAGREVVTFTSWVKQMDWANAGLDLVCLTSLNEGTPVSLIEAQAACNPILSTHVGGVEDVMIPDRTGILVDRASPEDFSRQLLRLISDRALREQMGMMGRGFVMEKFHYRRLVREMKEHYDELLGKMA